MFWFYQAQGLLAVLLSLTVWTIASASRTGWSAWDLVAILLAAASLYGEALADRQLSAWRTDPANRGRTCRSGLWRFSRHPNYFFEWLAWCAFALLALPAPLGWLGLSAPLIMLLLLLKVTGVPPAEEQAVRSRGDDYRAYQRSTSAFFPWFPKEGTT
jgi:steroid 5-alpha reductase family enzyme